MKPKIFMAGNKTGNSFSCSHNIDGNYVAMYVYSFAYSPANTYIHTEIFVAQNFHKFCKKICLRENIIMNITAYSVIVFLDTCLICEIKMQKSYFEAFRGYVIFGRYIGNT